MTKAIRPMVKLVFLFIFLSGIFLSGIMEAATSEEASVAKLIEGAKKEGRLSLYSSVKLENNLEILKKFESKYPFIKTDQFRVGAQALLVRILNEAKAKRLQADVVINGQMRQYVASKAGLFQKYVSPESRNISDDLKDKEGYVSPIFLNPYCMTYNTRLVALKDLPKTYEDLLQPKWKGKVGMNNRDYEWFANMVNFLGESKAMNLMEKLSTQVTLRDSQTLLLQLSSAGEFPISISTFASNAEELKAQGAPIDWIPLFPALAQVQPMGIVSTTPHPNAAKLFVDFVLSREGQEIIKIFNKVPTNMNVESPLRQRFKGFKIYPNDVSLGESFEKYQDLFKEIFLKRKH